MRLLPEPMSLAASGILRKLPVAATDRPSGWPYCQSGVAVPAPISRAYSTPRAAPTQPVWSSNTLTSSTAGFGVGTKRASCWPQNCVLAVTRDAETLRRHVLCDLGVIGSERRTPQLPDDVARGTVDQEDRVQVPHGHEDVAVVRARRIFVDRDRVAVVDVGRCHAVGGRQLPCRTGIGQPARRVDLVQSDVGRGVPGPDGLVARVHLLDHAVDDRVVRVRRRHVAAAVAEGRRGLAPRAGSRSSCGPRWAMA